MVINSVEIVNLLNFNNFQNQSKYNQIEGNEMHVKEVNIYY